MPHVCVILPMRNAEPYVRAAIDSILSQAGVDLDVLVVNDGSTDRSAEIVRGVDDPRVRMIEGPQQGIAAAFNAALAITNAEFVARCDADDLYPPDRLKWQLDFLQNRANFAAVCGSVATMTHRGKMLPSPSNPAAYDMTDELKTGRGRSHICAYLFRADVLKQLGGCRSFFVTAEDVDLQLRLAETGSVWFDPRPAYLYRLHDASITHTQKANERSYYETCAREFQRQRQSRPDGKDDLQLGRPPAPPAADNSAAISSRQQVQKMLLGQAWNAHASGVKRAALSLGFRAVITRPWSIKSWRSFLALIMKPSGKQCGH